MEEPRRVADRLEELAERVAVEVGQEVELTDLLELQIPAEEAVEAETTAAEDLVVDQE